MRGIRIGAILLAAVVSSAGFPAVPTGADEDGMPAEIRYVSPRPDGAGNTKVAAKLLKKTTGTVAGTAVFACFDGELLADVKLVKNVSPTSAGLVKDVTFANPPAGCAYRVMLLDGDGSSLRPLASAKRSSEFTLNMEENFNGALSSLSTKPNSPTGWNIADKWDGHKSGNKVYGLRMASAVSVEDGCLKLTAQMVRQPDGTDKIVSGLILNRYNYTYGKFEFRVKSDPDPGTGSGSSAATNAVVLTWPDGDVWPRDGENDIYETGTNKARDKMHTYIHYGTPVKDKDGNITKYNDAKAQKEGLTVGGVTLKASEWHTVAMEWEPTEIRILVDGAYAWSTDNETAIPDVPHNFRIQLDAFADTIAGSASMYVDWVKIYSYSDLL